MCPKELDANADGLIDSNLLPAAPATITEGQAKQTTAPVNYLDTVFHYTINRINDIINKFNESPTRVMYGVMRGTRLVNNYQKHVIVNNGGYAILTDSYGPEVFVVLDADTQTILVDPDFVFTMVNTNASYFGNSYKELGKNTLYLDCNGYRPIFDIQTGLFYKVQWLNSNDRQPELQTTPGYIHTFHFYVHITPDSPKPILMIEYVNNYSTAAVKRSTSISFGGF